jgi:cytochrome d ubiquinol oxidase subunit II
MSLEVLLAGALMLSIIFFALTAGADFGGGLWNLLSWGEQGEEQRELIDEAIGPIWEANELWVVGAIVIIWTAFPPAFAAYGIALFIPFILGLAGIVVRGAFFAFRHEAQENIPQRAYEVFGRVFGGASAITPIFFGMAAGAIASGAIRLENGIPATGYVQSWLSPFPIIVGLLALAICAYLAAVYLTMEPGADEQLQEDFRLRGLIASVAVAILGPIALLLGATSATYLWRGLTGGLGLAFMIIAVVCLIGSAVLLFFRRYWLARAAAIVHVVAAFCAWGVAQYPYLLIPDITISSAAAPNSVLVAELIVVVFSAVVLGPFLVYLFRLFKQGERSGGGE